MSKIYNFLKGGTASWLEERLFRKLKETSVFVYQSAEKIPWKRIKQQSKYFLYDDGENEKYMFAYKSRYATLHWKDLPRFHSEVCRTRVEFSNFDFASSMPVNITCTDQNKLLGPKRLKYCRNCNKEINFFSFGTKDKEWFDVIVEIAADRSKQNEYSAGAIRLDGYTKDWQQVSYARRAQEDFNCQNCSVHLADNDAYFLEVHHKDYNRLNNRKENLEVLCVRCHANVDERHLQNYSYGENSVKLNIFNNRFG